MLFTNDKLTKFLDKNESQSKRLQHEKIKIGLMVQACSLENSLNQGAIAKYARTPALQLTSVITRQRRFLTLPYETMQERHYLPCIQAILESLRGKSLLLVIDSSKVATNCMSIMVSFIVEKTAVPLLWSVHQGEKGHLLEKYSIDLLRRVVNWLHSFDFKDITLLGDGEYSSIGLMNYLTENNINYILRIAKNSVLIFNYETLRAADLDDNVYLEGCSFTATNFKNQNVYCCKDEHNNEPIWLLSNTFDGFTMQVLYKYRFRIECLFKNFKSNTFRIHDSRISDTNRVANLLLIAAVAYAFMFRFRKVAEIAQNEGKIANAHRKDDSDFRLAWKFVKIIWDKNILHDERLHYLYSLII